MYAVVGYFGPQSEEQIKTIWNELSDRGISEYAFAVKGNRPHITLAGYDSVDESSFIGDMETFYKEKEAFDVEMNVLGTFLGSGTLFLNATMTKALFEFHWNHHNAFHSYQDTEESLYLPGKWIPHCTIANYLEEGNLQKAFDYCTKNMNAVNATIQEVSLIKVVTEEDEVKEAVNLYSIELLQNK